MQKIVAMSQVICIAISINEVHWNPKFTKHQLGGECSHRILPFNQTFDQTDTNT